MGVLSMIDLYAYRFGVNYTPTREWWYCWNDFQADAIERDLDAIAALEADHIRIMLLWPSFQPNPRAVSPAHLERLVTLVDLAAARNLDVCASLFVGWLSGYSFKPPYQQDADFYALGEALQAQELYMTRVAETLRPFANFLGFDLGNELNCCWSTDDFGWHASPEKLAQGDAWQEHMLALAAHLIPEGPHVNGVDHNPWFHPSTFSPVNLARTQPTVALHCWSYFTGALQQAGGDPFGPASLHLLATMATLARAYAGDARKPIWAQEFGMSEEWMPAAHIPRFLEETMTSGIEAGVSWFTWWCSHDLDPTLAFHPLEYSLGLITHEQQIKPHGAIFRDLARAYRGRRVDPARLPDLVDPPSEHSMEATWAWLNALTAHLQ